MFLITSRKSRFFVVLLHLIGVSTHLPSLYWSETGIVGVNPFSIVLERLDPLTLLDGADQQGDEHNTPYWLQDAADGSCLDPIAGFSDCGDATLWLLLPRKRKDARRRQLLRWAIDQDEDDTSEDANLSHGYALQLMDDDNSPPSLSATTNGNTAAQISSINKSKGRYADKECLTRRRKDNKLLLAPCSQERSWSWHVNSQGILHFEHPSSSSSWFSSSTSSKKGSSRKTNRQRLKKHVNEQHKQQGNLECIWKNASSHALLLPCTGQADVNVTTTRAVNEKEEESPQIIQRVVQFALVRQATTDPTQSSSTSTVSSSSSSSVPLPSLISDETIATERTRSSESASIPSSSESDIAHSHASGSPSGTKMHPDLKRISSSLLYADPSYNGYKASSENDDSKRSTSSPSTKPPLHFFKDSNPILLANGRVLAMATSTEDSTKNSMKKKSMVEQQQSQQTATLSSINGDPFSKTSSSSPSPSSPTIRAVRKIRVHPYIDAAKDEIWTDPLTGLEYRTDLCRYLGDDRKETGRHTLTGVGQYMRTVFNIKVYGVSFYVSKRDVLADETMEPYASLSSEELRERPDFFNLLRIMGDTSTSSNMRGGLFDRTLLLKTNMQLSTETMRSSLEADWKMLTDEAKETLINSSIRARPAGDKMLAIIKSADNPSRCSCAQSAPAEYEADPNCCARGTELAFTWRKNGLLEIRVNGFIMDAFPRTDIAEGIFFEYLRLDDPMSPDFLDRVVDGFPFLLAPLNQVKGVSTPVRSQSSSSTSKSTGSSSSSNPVIKAIGGFGDVVSSHAMGFAGFVKDSTNEMTSNAVHTARSVGDAARQFGEEMDRRRDALGERVSALANNALSSLYSRDGHKALSARFPQWVGRDGRRQFFLSRLAEGDGDLEGTESANANAPRGRIFGHPFARFFGEDETMLSAADEIVPMIHPSANSTHRIFFGLVHLYLLLLLIVSFPAQLTKRTKLIVIRKAEQHKSQQHDMSDSEVSSESETSSDLHYLGTPKASDPTSSMLERDASHDGAASLPQQRSPIHRILKSSMQGMQRPAVPRSPQRLRTIRFNRNQYERRSNEEKDGNMTKSLSYAL